MFLLGGCSEAKQEKQKTNNPIAYTSTEFETTEIPAQEESYVLHASKIHSKSPTALETAINNIIRDAKGYEDEHEKFIGFLDCAVDDENLPAFYIKLLYYIFEFERSIQQNTDHTFYH